jgi:hypothetical protein
MKKSKRNIVRAVAKTAKFKGGPPKVSKYAAKYAPPKDPTKTSPPVRRA